MTSPFERFAKNSLELSLMRRGFNVFLEPTTFTGLKHTPDLIVTSSDSETTFAIEIKHYRQKSLLPPNLFKPRRIHFQSREIPVYTVAIKSTPQRIYIPQELADILQTKDEHFAIARSPV